MSWHSNLTEAGMQLRAKVKGNVGMTAYLMAAALVIGTARILGSLPTWASVTLGLIGAGAVLGGRYWLGSREKPSSGPVPNLQVDAPDLDASGQQLRVETYIDPPRETLKDGD